VGSGKIIDNQRGGNMYQIKKLDLATVALYSFLLFFFMGLLFILPFWLLFSIIGSSIPDLQNTGMGFLPFFSGVFIIIIPVIYATFGTILNMIIVLFYNFFAGRFGGIKLELKEISGTEPSLQKTQ
jgi:hypothetical protein